MSFIIRNTSAGSVSIDDLGINLQAPLDEHDLRQEPPNDVAISVDLPAHITAGNIVALDPLDGVTVLSVPDSLELIAATNDPHFRIRGGRAIDVSFDNTGTDNPGTDLQVAVADNSGKVEWKGLWGEITYDKHDMVRDDEWTMIANTQTSDRAGPQEVGGTETSPPTDAIFTTGSDISVVKMVHHYVTTKDGIAVALRVRIPLWDLDSISRITIFNITNNTAEVVDNPILTSDDWVTIRATGALIPAGTVFEVWFEFYNSTAANNITGGWNSLQSAGAPASQQFTIDNLSNPTSINISHTDLDSTNRSTELDGVVVGSIITISETSVPDRNIDAEVTAVDTAPASATDYTVTLLQNGSQNVRSGRICTVNISVPITQPSQYSFIPDFYLGTTNQPSFATITTELYYDGVQQADVDDAYGIEVIFQELAFSPDWDVVAVSGGSGGSSGEGSIVLDDILDVNAPTPVNTQILEFDGTNWSSIFSPYEPRVNSIHTGGQLSVTSPTQLTIQAGDGIYLDGTTDPKAVTSLHVQWITTILTPTQTGQVNTGFVLINSAGVISTVDSLTPTTFRDFIIVGGYYYLSGVIQTAANFNHAEAQQGYLLKDLIEFLPESTLFKGLVVKDNGATNTLQRGSGTRFLPSGNWEIDRKDPNIFPYVSQVPLAFTGISQLDVILTPVGSTAFDPSLYDNAGVITSIPAGNASIQYIFMMPDGTHFVQLGQSLYSSLNDARNSAQSDLNSFITAGFTDQSILLTQLIVDRDATDFSDTSQALILNFGTSSGGAGVDAATKANHLFRHNDQVTQTISQGVLATINFDTDVRTDSIYTHNIVTGGSEITINATGWYNVHYDLTIDDASNARTSSQSELQLNGVIVNGTLAFGYHRNTSNGDMSYSSTVKLLLSVGDVIRVQALGVDGNVQTVADGCRLTIESIDSP